MIRDSFSVFPLKKSAVRSYKSCGVNNAESYFLLQLDFVFSRYDFIWPIEKYSGRISSNRNRRYITCLNSSFLKLGPTAKSQKLLKLRIFVLWRKILALTTKKKKNLRTSTLPTSEPETCMQEIAVRYFEIVHDFTTAFFFFQIEH